MWHRFCLTSLAVAIMGLLAGCQPPADTGNSAPAKGAPEKPAQSDAAAPPAPTPAPEKAPAPPPPAPAKTEEAPPPPPKPEPVVVREWDLVKTPLSEIEWYFPGGTPQQNDKGIWYVTDNLLSGPILRKAGVDAEAVGGVRVSVQVIVPEKGPQPVTAAQLYWARPDDISEGVWPFRDARSVVFRQDEKDPQVWVASPEGHALWNGQIAEIMIRYDLTPDGEANGVSGFNVFTKRIEFLK